MNDENDDNSPFVESMVNQVNAVFNSINFGKILHSNASVFLAKQYPDLRSLLACIAGTNEPQMTWQSFLYFPKLARSNTNF